RDRARGPRAKRRSRGRSAWTPLARDMAPTWPRGRGGPMAPGDVVGSARPPVALLVLLPAPARAGIVPARLVVHRHRLLLRRLLTPIGGQLARVGARGPSGGHAGQRVPQPRRAPRRVRPCPGGD